MPIVDSQFIASKLVASKLVASKLVASKLVASKLIRIFVTQFLILSFFSSFAQAESLSTQAGADKILYNVKVYSLAWPQPARDGTSSAMAPKPNGKWQPDGRAVVIDDGLIKYVGSKEQAWTYKGEETELIDLGGATAIPGLIDSHVHVAELGQVLSRINLTDVGTPAEVIEMLEKHAKKSDDGGWVLGQGWDEGAWANNYPDRALLDSVFPKRPVVLKSLHGFAVWVNTAALKAAGITAKTVAPVGGEILKDKSGQPSGIFLNRATTLINDAVPAPSAAQFEQHVRLGLQQMAKDGYVAVHEAGAETPHMTAFKSLRDKNELPVRVYAMVSARDTELAEKWIANGPMTDPEGWLDIRSVKAYYDGALGSRGARLLEDYSDQPGHRGVSGDGYGFDGELVERMIAAGFQVGIHAIGDAGNRETLDYLQQVNSRVPASISLRHRIEHAQVVHPDDFKRFTTLNLIASMEPPHAVEDKTWAEARVGEQRIKGAYAWRRLREVGAALTFNSDLPGSDHSIFYGLHAAVTRRDKQVMPAQGWHPEEALTIEESLLAYTHWAAYSAFRENQTGMLDEGRWADITIMDIDPFAVAESQPEELLNGKIVMTIVNGKVVFAATDLIN